MEKVPEWVNKEETLKPIREKKPPYHYFFSLAESSCQVYKTSLAEEPGCVSQNTENLMGMIGIRKDDYEGTKIVEKLDEYLEKNTSERVMYFILLDSMYYLFHSIQLLKERVSNINVHIIDNDHIRFNESAHLFLISLYDNLINDKTTEVDYWNKNDGPTSRMLEQKLFMDILAKQNQTLSPMPNLQEEVRRFSDTLFSTNEWTEEEKKEWKDKYEKLVEPKQDGTYNYETIQANCLRTFPDWDYYQLVMLFFDYVVDKKGILPKFRHLFLSLCKEYILRPSKDWLLQVRNAIIDIQSQPL
jgi:hypothetical protein